MFRNEAAQIPPHSHRTSRRPVPTMTRCALGCSGASSRHASMSIMISLGRREPAGVNHDQIIGGQGQRARARTCAALRPARNARPRCRWECPRCVRNRRRRAPARHVFRKIWDIPIDPARGVAAQGAKRSQGHGVLRKTHLGAALGAQASVTSSGDSGRTTQGLPVRAPARRALSGMKLNPEMSTMSYFVESRNSRQVICTEGSQASGRTKATPLISPKGLNLTTGTVPSCSMAEKVRSRRR